MNMKISVFIILLMFSTLLAITSTNTMFTWMMMELNMMVFTPLICLLGSTNEADTSIKYLVPQSLASSLFLMSIIMTSYWPYSNVMASISLLMKAGSAPFHTWFPAVMYSINLMAGFLMMTWQKLIPLFMIMNTQLSYPPLILMSAAITSLWGSVAGLNQTNMMSLLTFSSIAHLSWLISASILNPNTFLFYFAIYTLTLLPIFLVMQIFNKKTHKAMLQSSVNIHPKMILTLNLLSLAGMPPFAMFSAKIPIIIMMTKSLPILAVMLISTTISLCFYMTIIFSILLSTVYLMSDTIKNSMLKNSFALSVMFQLSCLPLTLYFISN
uniref:NADH-ubiquinone oxidoreductase chain 2 n=1 Tax=Sinanodonta woodiana TaxID=1069815 RepID=A0A346HGX4_SINWO|nr:NADH dehydrogenase subunit 2 [Sinanodonta woodiana]AXO78660.1 NADH dehydrogenase subunit 2 [Sinanodonta woodiana]